MMLDDKEWEEAEASHEEDKAALLAHVASLPKDSKQRRKQFPKGQWPGKQGDDHKKKRSRKPKTETVAPAQPSKPKPKRFREANPNHIEDGEGWTCVVFIGDEEVKEFHSQRRNDAKRATRAYIRETLGLSIRTAFQHEEPGQRTTVIRFSSDE